MIEIYLVIDDDGSATYEVNGVENMTYDYAFGVQMTLLAYGGLSLYSQLSARMGMDNIYNEDLFRSFQDTHAQALRDIYNASLDLPPMQAIGEDGSIEDI